MKPVLLAVLAAIIQAAPAAAQAVLFNDDFHGPTLNPVFQSPLPDGAPQGDGTGSCTYVGTPNFTFVTVGGASTIRLSNTLNSWQRVGWRTATSFAATDFRFEVRFNTLVQSPTTSIDSFIEAWLIDAADPSRYDFAGPSGMNFGVVRQFRSGGSIDGQYDATGYDYLDNTWYRLVIGGSATENIRTSLFADDGTTELIGRTLGHTAAAYPAGFRLGLGQATGAPGAPYPVDVAIDWVQLTGTPVPEPSALFLSGLAACGVRLARRAKPV